MVFLALLLNVTPTQIKKEDTWQTLHCTHLHAELLRRLALLDEASTLNPNPPRPPVHITVALLKSGLYHGRMRVTICGGNALPETQLLLSILDEPEVFHCEHQSYHVLSADLAHFPLAAVSTWSDLLVSSPQLPLRLNFLSPTIFTRTSTSSIHEEVFPYPIHVFSPLLATWNHLQGPELSSEVISWLQSGECLVSDYRLQAEQITLVTETGAVKIHLGWRGWITYTCREPQPAFMAILRRLARLACFTGSGDYTEFGLGVTQLS